MAVAVVAAAAVAVAVAVAVSDMAGEERISAGSDVSCFAVASGKLWRRRVDIALKIIAILLGLAI